MSLPKSPSQFELAKAALRIERPPNNENLGWSSSPSYGTRSPSSPYTPPVFNRLKSSYAAVGKAVPSPRKSRKNRKGSRRANRKGSRRANRKASRKNRKSRN
jgi:hypothetical protein